MSNVFMAAIIQFAGNFAPRSWAFCQGQTLSIAQNTALFSLLGTTYGGNGQTTFQLPDFRGRVPVGTGQGPGLSNVVLGEIAGEPSHTLTINEMPQHNHSFNGSTSTLNFSSAAATSQSAAAGSFLARKNVDLSAVGSQPAIYAPAGSAVGNALGGLNVAGTIGGTGGSQPHNNMQPYLGMNFIIAIQGIYPSRN
jgi:microcystin-dependent protein